MLAWKFQCISNVIDHQIIEAKAEESALSTVIQPSPSSSAKSNCIDRYIGVLRYDLATTNK